MSTSRVLLTTPHLTHGDVEDVDLDKLGNYLKNVTTSGLLVPDEGVEDYIREAAGLPKRLDDYVPMRARTWSRAR